MACCAMQSIMSEQPEERNKDSKKAAKDNIEQPVGKQDPTEPVTVEGSGAGQGGGSAAREGKGTTTASGGAAGL